MRNNPGPMAWCVLYFGTFSVLVWFWVQLWLRLYPSWLFVALQTTAIVFASVVFVRTKSSLWHGIFSAVMVGWLISISAHQLLSFLFIDNFLKVWADRVRSDSVLAHVWFVSYSSLLFMGPLQSLVLYGLRRRATDLLR